MRVGLLIITHRRIGSETLAAAERALGICPLQTRCLEVFNEDDRDELIARARRLLEELDSGAGVLILTDAYGATPSNIAVEAAAGRTSRVVSGINLPMLLCVFNYPSRWLAALAESAARGGRAGVVHIGQEEPKP
ncbi:PTS sugar transporter subunit IIA [Halorhodospira neutriphila]|uniref:PTS EIIA type-4 domain-containing protein n=1 Tax=Halorhodospira neutriphila TaxID=168379 RepID=A0ABS1E5Y3_9GAMM|nr:PTS fructose transporter subunit IIA [Halorhodospira neutriphila]MBK1726537.1 hypothetical protein [Halorhodospira neutriphila]